MFCPVDELSDDGDKDRLPSVTSLSDSCSGVAGRKRKKRKRARSVAQPSNLQCDNLRLRALLGKPCKKGQCKGGCMALFSHGSDFAELKAFRNEWAELHKLDQDVVAFDRIRTIWRERGSGKATWKFLGHKVCARAWKRLHGLGNGRFERLLATVKTGAVVPPADLRYLRAHHARAEHGEGASARVMSFLQSVYDSVAENIAGLPG
ncbi:unnamed protein product [Effrenium voratum]|nr:unnamed protein product [Effrenium voratum]